MSDNSWITKEALHAAMDIVYKHLQGDWPDDDWVSIGNYHDLNMYHYYEGGQKIMATLYPVVNNSPDTQRFVKVFELKE